MAAQKKNAWKGIRDFFIRIFLARPEEKTRDSQKPPADSFDLSGMFEKEISPLNNPVWRLLLLVLGGSFLLWLFSLFSGLKTSLSLWIISLLALAALGAAVRMLFLETRLKKFWTVLLAAGFLLLLLTVFVPELIHVSGVIALVFLLFRRYRPYRHLTSRRRAVLFFLGIVAFLLLTAGFSDIPPNPADDQTEGARVFDAFSLDVAPRFEDNLARFGIWSLRLFWFFTLFHLFFGIRLHFMKIRPKLALSSFLITAVPVFLIALMSVVIITSTLGLNRAARAQSVLLDWTDFAAENPEFIGALTGRSFAIEAKAGDVNTRGDSPGWLPEFLLAAASRDPQETASPSKKKAFYLWADQKLWLIRFSGETTGNYRVDGGQVDEAVMDRLASILHSDVKLSLTNPIRFSALGKETVLGLKSEAGDVNKKEIAGKHPSDTEGGSLWQKKFYSGMTQLDVTDLSGGEFVNFSLLLLTEGSVAGLLRDIFSEKNPLSLVVMAVLLILAVMLLLMEGFALYFGLRITGGITSAVKALHKGVRRIARGDLTARITIPNEDELGDLASSFNEMTVAVIKGKEEALAREQLERELKTARDIQKRLLPHKMPHVPGFEISGTNLPSHQVGGDFFDFLELESGYLGIAIADVCGKGIPAALLMANLQASLHGQAAEPGQVATVITRMNDLLVRSTDPHMFATFFYGVLDRRRFSFTSTNAGHNPPLHFRSDGQYQELETNGLIIGFLPKQKYSQQTINIDPGDVLVLYTDGITEATRKTEEDKEEDKYFGVERLVAVIMKNLQKSARDIQSEIIKAISEFSAGAPQADDITLVVIKRSQAENKPGETR